MEKIVKEVVSKERKLSLNFVVEKLLENNLIDTDHANKIIRTKFNDKTHPFIIISDFKIKNITPPHEYLTNERLTTYFSTIFNLDYIHLDPLKIKLEHVAHLIPFSYAKRLNIVPIEINKSELVICTSEPFQKNWIEELSPIVKRKIKLVFGNPDTILKLLDELEILQNAINRLHKENRSSNNNKFLREGKLDELDRLIEKNKLKKWAAEDSAVSQIIEWILKFSLNERATDIHLEPKKGMGHIRLRIDGNLRPIYKLDPEILLSVISRFKLMADLKIDEKRKPQDGRIKKLLDNDLNLEMRISTVPTQYGEKLVVRLFDYKLSGKNLDEIGLGGKDLKVWRELINLNQGLLLVTGPTGSGKTTTLYSSLNEINTPEVNICTVEDPVEMCIDEFNQVQVNRDINLTFSNAIKTFLRQDPDIIMVGEIRDIDTAEVAIQASLTGHLVFSTVHTNSALSTIIRLLDLGVAPYLLNSSIVGILAQRLVRKLCPHCKEKTDTPEELWENLVGHMRIPTPKKIFKAVGCSECKFTGYFGRICVYELLPITNEIKSIIREKIQLTELEEKCKKYFTPFRYHAAEKVMLGETTLEEMIKIVF